jgi:hypothetical protein
MSVAGALESFLKKIIKNRGRNFDLRVGTVATSRIVGSNEMEIPG